MHFKLCHLSMSSLRAHQSSRLHLTTPLISSHRTYQVVIVSGPVSRTLLRKENTINNNIIIDNDNDNDNDSENDSENDIENDNDNDNDNTHRFPTTSHLLSCEFTVRCSTLRNGDMARGVALTQHKNQMKRIFPKREI